MDAAHDTTVEGRVARVEEEFRARQTKFVIRFAVAEAILMALAVVIVLVAFQPVEKQYFGIALAIIVIPCGVVMAVLLRRMGLQRVEAIAAARGETQV